MGATQHRQLSVSFSGMESAGGYAALALMSADMVYYGGFCGLW